MDTDICHSNPTAPFDRDAHLFTIECQVTACPNPFRGDIPHSRFTKHDFMLMFSFLSMEALSMYPREA